MKSALRGISASLLLALVSGCGDGRPGLVEATGAVTLDGKPLAGAMVSFQPLETSADGFQRPVTGVTDPSGKFTLGTYGKGDGAPTGKYAVAIQKRELAGGKLPENYNSEDPNAVPLKYLWITPRGYSDPNSSGLEAEITSSGVEPDVFALDSGGGPPEVEMTGPGRRRNEP